MKTDTSKKILEYTKNRGHVTGRELAGIFNISDRAIRKQLSKLLDLGAIEKSGKPPKVYYSISQISHILKIKEKEGVEDKVSNIIKKQINKNYLIVTPFGQKKEGFEGFAYWCKRNSLPVKKTADEYLKTLNKYNKYKKGGVIDGTYKLKKTFDKVFLNKVLYLDFYSIERFGKTKLGQLLLYAKQSQNRSLMIEIIKEIQPNVNNIIKKYKIDGLGFIPPTVKREIQIMRVLEREFSGNNRRIKISKVKMSVAVPQKTLNKLEDRIDNAKNTIVVEENTIFNNILLIDDAVGSGSTLNEVARKIKMKHICKGKIIGLAITGSFKGFDVISEI